MPKRIVLGPNPANPTVTHNKDSWSIILSIINAYGGATEDDLAAAVSQHNHPEGGAAFIRYCIRNGWLVESGQAEK